MQANSSSSRPFPEIRAISSIPPHNLEAEEAILGGLLIDPHAIDRVIDLIVPESFYMGAHGDIYRAIADLHAEGKPIDLVSVFNYLHDRKLLDKVGGKNRLADLVEFTMSAVNIDQYAQIVQDKYIRRRLLAASNEIAQIAHNTDFSIEVILDQAEQRIFRIGHATSGGGLVPVSESIHETFSDIESRSLGDVSPGISCGFFDLDAMTQGFQRSDLIIVAARPSMGKTAFALNVASGIAGTHKFPVAIFSLEMSKEQINRRLISSSAQIETGRLVAGRVKESEWSDLGMSIAYIAETPIAVDDSAFITLSTIRSRSRRFAAQSGELGAVIIDYLQLLEGGDDGNRVQELSRITRGLKQLARELNCPVIALSQLSRGVESRTNKRPMMSDLRESGSIEQDADLIMMLYRDEYYNPETPDRGIAEVNIVKHRNGPIGTVKLLFEPHYSRFRNLARNDYA